MSQLDKIGTYPFVAEPFHVDFTGHLTIGGSGQLGSDEVVGLIVHLPEQPVELPLCRVCEDARYYIEEIARWRTEGFIRERRMQEYQEMMLQKGPNDGILSDEKR